MSYSYIAYIDESGDDGFKFRSPTKGGSSHWLVISCAVARYANDLRFVRWRDEIRDLIPSRKKRDIHFRELTHSQKIMACQKISTFSIRTVSAMCNKTALPVGSYTKKNEVYYEVTRQLVWRLSWLCKTMRQLVPEGNGKVKIIFSRRGGIDYGDFQEYFRNLQRLEAERETQNIYWPVIDIEGIVAQDHGKMAGLQIADCVSSAYRMAVDPDEFGNCEQKYAEILKGNTYSDNNRHLYHGIEPIPSLETMELSQDQEEFFRKFYPA